ncbi:MAG: phosphoribosyltransferase [Candidatus Hydrogenedentes bacterium]|nr:phosphoribosyltransferase [Candidatus Hydrogenedentota bacterium]
MVFKDRVDAGRMLARRLRQYEDAHPAVLALPRGGVVVGYQVAEELDAPLDIIVARKLGAPSQPELAIGAVVDGDAPQTVLNEEIVRDFRISKEQLEAIVARELAEVERRQKTYRKGRPPTPIEGRTVIVVDDGIATGASVRAALRGLRRKPIGKLVLAVPVAPQSTVREMQSEVDDLVCVHAPLQFGAVGAFYKDFDQTTDEEVIELLEDAQRWAPEPAGAR